MADILLSCPESLAPTPAGVGIRFLELARVLVRSGFAVTLLTPDGNCGEAGIVCEKTSPHTIRDFSARSAVAIVQGHAANDFFAHRTPVPTVVDLYDPFIVENFQYFESLGPQVFENDLRTLNSSLAHGDFFLCASEAQRQFYLGALVSTGRLDPTRYAADVTCRSLIDVVPFGVPPVVEGAPSRERQRVLFGGIYDWYDPLLAIEAVGEARRRRLAALTLTFNRHPNAAITPQSKLAAAEKAASGNDFVDFSPWVPYDKRLSQYREHSVALLTFEPSLETDLAMRTRIFDYLWAGLPVITSSAPGTDGIIERYAAGLIVNRRSASAFAEALESLLLDGSRYAQAVNGAKEWAAGHGWDRVAEPLIRFCEAPRFDSAHSISRGERSKGWTQRIKNVLGGSH